MGNLDTVLAIMRSPQNGMRKKHPVIIDINDKVGWLHLTGGAQHSMMAWLDEFHRDEVKEHLLGRTRVVATRRHHGMVPTL